MINIKTYGIMKASDIDDPKSFTGSKEVTTNPSIRNKQCSQC
jgi:hypothetical protein